VYDEARCVLAIHNLAHQGSFPAHCFNELCLPGEAFGLLEWKTPNNPKNQMINVLKVRQLRGQDGMLYREE
jgi:starch synthase